MVFGQMPAARADHQHRRRIAHRIVLAAVRIGVIEPAEPVIAQVHLALDQLIPNRRSRVLEIGHVGLGAAVERVDQHLGVGRPGDFDPAIEEVGRDRSDGPFGFAEFARVLGEIGKLARVEPRLAVQPRVEQRKPPTVEALVQLGEEFERRARQHVVRATDAGWLRNDLEKVQHFAHCSTGSTQIE